ncbi:hypothetical protein Thermo_00794 [Thermoplasmatales archaeon]|nr:hypothetical protein Thermo_00794 [Thermoplasmatales archaeon]
MEDTNDRDMNFSENFVIISSRKTDFLTIFIKIFIQKLKSEGKVHITPGIISKIVHIVASLDPLLFVSPSELEEGHLHLDTKLEKLDREKIGEEVYRKMSEEGEK